MAELSRCVMAVLLACSWAVGMSGSVQPQKVNADAQLQLEFKQRIDDYMKLHERLEKQSPPLKKTDEPAQIKASQDGLAGALRAARANAKQGDIFTPAIAQLFRRLVYPEVHGTDGAQTKKIMKEDAPAAISLKVNARYPDTAPLPTVPPNLLANLPQLPKDLEYRVVNNALILRDVHANLIVDFIPKAIR